MLAEGSRGGANFNEGFMNMGFSFSFYQYVHEESSILGLFCPAREQSARIFDTCRSSGPSLQDFDIL